jgi:3-dehydroquinate dehydratase-2
LIIINGPNLNLLGKREPDVYGYQDFEEYLLSIRSEFPEITLDYFQSNIEGEIINAIQDPGGYSHTSVAIADAIKAVPARIIEVHITNLFSREGFRHTCITAPVTDGFISGLGLDGYRLAILAFLRDQR